MTPSSRNVQSWSAGGFALVAIAAALWGSDGLFRRGLALELPAATVVMVEHAILVALTCPLLVRALRVLKSLRPAEWVALIAIGAGASALATLLFTEAFTYGDPTTPLLLQKLQPLFAIAGAAIILDERLLPRFGLYFIAAVTGAYLISFPDPTAVSVSGLAPAALSIAAAGLWGFGTVLGRYLLSRIPFPELTALRFAIGLPAAAIMVVVQDGGESLATIGRQDAVALLLLAAVPGFLGVWLYYRGLMKTPASAATLAELAFPISAVTINYLAFGTTLEPNQWVGVALLSVTVLTMSAASRRGPAAIGIAIHRRVVGRVAG